MNKPSKSTTTTASAKPENRAIWRNNGRIHGRTNQVEIIRNDYSWQGRSVIIIKGEDCDEIASKIFAALNA